ncbi:hypothetical protein ACHAQJ_000248 [Trichoderma viride]
MPISALPQPTVRILGSSVVITTPCDVVKELIDNAVDAGASFVDVAISPNYLDTIRVRDDGHGIDVGDFDVLGRQAHTSKLNAFDELGSRARETLGFRGEALAAMNTFGGVSIMTRTANDVVATRLQLKRAVGGAENRQPVSAPVGTTVHITKLFDTLPARKQYCLKNSAKYIQSTKDLLKAYALARPDLRLSFKVLGEATACWSYAPTCATGVNEATLQILGKPLANSCIQVSRNSACDQAAFPQTGQQISEDFILEALIPKPGFDVQAIKGKGLYLSVDSRPISSTRGIARKITTVFKRHLNRVADSDESCINISSPFLRLNIRCPAYSYDANVTPLKDEVVFGDESKILACFEGLCQKIYPERSMDDPFITQRPSKYNGEAATLTAHKEHSEGIHLNEKSDYLPDIQRPDYSSTHQLLRYSPNERSLTLTKMRTSKMVNLSRTDSNSTDENSTTNSVEIQVPLSLMTATQIPPGPRANSSARIPKIPASENIELYLLSRKKEDFQIATDETATKRGHLPPIARESHSGVSCSRMPLQPLTESMLNAMSGQPESESDASSAESEMSASGDNAESIISTYLREQRVQQTSPVPIPSSLEPGPLEPRSPRQSRNVAEWLTPPSSGPLRSVRSSNAPFRPPQRTLERDSPTRNTAHARPQPRASQSGRIIPFSLPGENRIQQGVAHGQTTERVGLPDTRRPNTRETRPQLYFRGVHGLNRQQDSTTNVSGLASQPDTRQHVSQPKLPLHESGQHPHLMKSQPPNAISMSGAAQDGLNAHDTVSTTDKCDVLPSIETSVCDISQNRAPLSKAHGNLEDSRLYLIKRRRSQARHGIARRLSSSRLPLEATPNHLSMQNASTSRRVSPRKIRALAKQTLLQEYDIILGDWGNAMIFKTMKEAGEMESRLQHVVEAWKEMQNQAVEVEYSLRSAAKGKNSMGR